MANTTETKILTSAGKALLADVNAKEIPFKLDKLIFANIPDRADFPQPGDGVPTEYVVFEKAVETRGKLSADVVIYTTTLESKDGPFEFNWTGGYSTEHGVLVTIDHHSLTPKTANEAGVVGNTLVRNITLEYKDIAEITNITVDAQSWQYNATPRMQKMDDDSAQAIIDQNGKDWFIEDGFLVTQQGSSFSIKAGAGYVSGNRVNLEFDRSVSVPSKPSFIYIDAHRDGTATGEQVTLFDFVITAEEKDDYTDTNGVKHFVCKIAEVLADGSVEDLRKGLKTTFEYFDKRRSKSDDAFPYVKKYLDFLRSIGETNAFLPDDTYVFSAPVSADGIFVEIAAKAKIVKPDGTPFGGFMKYNKWADPDYGNGKHAGNTLDSLKFGNVAESWIRPDSLDAPRKIVTHLNKTWYDGTAENAYRNCGVKHYETNIHYGFWNQKEGKPSSGSATGHIASIIVHGADKGQDGKSRTEIVPFGCGAVVHKDAELRPGALNIYNDFVVAGPVDPTANNREAFLAGISILAQTYSPYHAPDSEHSGSFGFCVTTKPQRAGAWDIDDRTEPSFGLRAMIAVSGWSGSQNATSGDHEEANVAAYYGILVGGGPQGEGGGSQWIGSYARSKFQFGAFISDYRLSAIEIDQPANDAEPWVHALRVKQGAGMVTLQNGELTLLNFPNSDAGLTYGEVYVTSDGTLKIAL